MWACLNKSASSTIMKADFQSSDQCKQILGTNSQSSVVVYVTPVAISFLAAECKELLHEGAVWQTALHEVHSLQADSGSKCVVGEP